MTIQRWQLRNGFRGEDSYKHEDGPYVWYTDHLAAMQRERVLAQIAVLEEMNSCEVPMVHASDGSKYIVRAIQKAVLLDKIAALRKELGE